jgi:hypothetical protein
VTKAVDERQLEKETEQQIGIDPIAAGERYREQLAAKLDKALRAIDNVTGKGLSKALEADRLFVGFSHDLATVTGRRVYEVRRSLHERLGSDFLRRQLIVLKHGGAPASVEQSELGKKIIAAIEAQHPRSKPQIFSGEDEYKKWLSERGLVETHVGVVPLTAQERRRCFET